jgi:hypothetical protein
VQNYGLFLINFRGRYKLSEVCAGPIYAIKMIVRIELLIDVKAEVMPLFKNEEIGDLLIDGA